jgi:hypothetical protein
MQANILRLQIGRFHTWSEANRASGQGLVITSWTLALQKKEQDLVDNHSHESMVPHWLAARCGRGLTTNDLYQIIDRIIHELRDRQYDHIPLFEFLPEYDESRARPGEIPPNARDKKRSDPAGNQRKRQSLKRAHNARNPANGSSRSGLSGQQILDSLPYGAQQEQTSGDVTYDPALSTAQGLNTYQQPHPSLSPSQVSEKRPMDSPVYATHANQGGRYEAAYTSRRASRGTFPTEQYGNEAGGANGPHLAPLREQYDYNEHSTAVPEARHQATPRLVLQDSSNLGHRRSVRETEVPASMYASFRDADHRRHPVPPVVSMAHMGPMTARLTQNGVFSGYVGSS